MAKVDTQNILGALQQGSQEMTSRAKAPRPAKASVARIGRPVKTADKVQMTCRISRELQRRIDQEIARVRAEGSKARSEATPGPVVEDLLGRPLGRRSSTGPAHKSERPAEAGRRRSRSLHLPSAVHER